MDFRHFCRRSAQAKRNPPFCFRFNQFIKALHFARSVLHIRRNELKRIAFSVHATRATFSRGRNRGIEQTACARSGSRRKSLTLDVRVVSSFRRLAHADEITEPGVSREIDKLFTSNRSGKRRSSFESETGARNVSESRAASLFMMS